MTLEPIPYYAPSPILIDMARTLETVNRRIVESSFLPNEDMSPAPTLSPRALAVVELLADIKRASFARLAELIAEAHPRPYSSP